MKKLLLLSALLIFACTDDEGNPCIYQPTLTTEEVTNITETSATLNGTIDITSENCETPNNTEQGFVYSTEIQPTLEDTQVNVNGTNISTTIEGLTPNTTYFVRAFLTNNLGDFYGDEVSFTTVAGQLILNTLEINEITATTAKSGGEILSDGNTTILSKGVCWSTNSEPTIENNFISNESDEIIFFECFIEELEQNTLYFLRSYATNEFGTFYGNELTFQTEEELDCTGGISCEGLPYPNIQIGSLGNPLGPQFWTTIDACHTTYSDGTIIPQVQGSEWANLTTGAWCYYDNDPTKGVLYNWYAIAGIHDNDSTTPNKKFAPDGWHVPTEEEYYNMWAYLLCYGYNWDGWEFCGGWDQSIELSDGNKIGRSLAYTSGWINGGYGTPGYSGSQLPPNNSSGFAATPTGWRGADAQFYGCGAIASYWTSTNESGENIAKAWSLHNNSFGPIMGNGSTTNFSGGRSVRFVKD